MSTVRPPTPADVAAARSVLDLAPDATRQEILTAWKRQVRLHHPDAVDPTARHAAEARTKQLNAAKSLLITAWELGIRAPQASTRSNAVGAAPRGRAPVPQAPRPPSAVHRPVGEAVTPIGSRWLWLLALSGVALAVVVLIASMTMPSGRSRIGGSSVGPATAPTTMSPPRPVPAHAAPDPTPPTAELLAEPESAALLLLEAAVERDYLAQRLVVDSSANYSQVQAWWTRVGNTDLDGADIDLARSALSCSREGTGERARCTFPTPLLVNLPTLELVYRVDAGWQVTGTVT